MFPTLKSAHWLFKAHGFHRRIGQSESSFKESSRHSCCDVGSLCCSLYVVVTHVNSLLGTIGTAWGWPAVENDWLADQIHPVFPKSKSRNMSDFEIVNQLNLFWNSALHGATWCDYIYIYASVCSRQGHRRQTSSLLVRANAMPSWQGINSRTVWLALGERLAVRTTVNGSVPHFAKKFRQCPPNRMDCHGWHRQHVCYSLHIMSKLLNCDDLRSLAQMDRLAV